MEITFPCRERQSKYKQINNRNNDTGNDYEENEERWFCIHSSGR